MIEDDSGFSEVDMMIEVYSRVNMSFKKTRPSLLTGRLKPRSENVTLIEGVSCNPS